VGLKRHKRFSLRMRLFEGTRRSRATSMSDPRTGGVTQEPRKTKENGVKNLLQATAISEFQSLIFFAFTVKWALDNHPEEKCRIKTDRSAAEVF
jgi:hypothetical protein